MDSVKQTLKEVLGSGFSLGFSLGVLYFGYFFSWIWALYPLSDYGISNRFLALFLMLLGYSGTVLVSALPWGIAAFFLKKWSTRNDAIAILSTAGVFTLAEYIRSWLFGIIWWGSGSVIGPYWTWGNIAYVLADMPLLSRTVSIWGIYGITFLVISLLMAVVVVTQRKKVTISILFITALLLCGTILASAYRIEDQTSKALSATIIQTKKETDFATSHGHQLEDLQKKLELLSQATQNLSDGDLVLLPEAANLSLSISKFGSSSTIKNFYERLTPSDVIIVDNIKRTEGEKTLSKVILLSSRRGVIGEYDKKILSPWGEFLPHIIEWPRRFLLRGQFAKPPTPLAAGEGGAVEINRRPVTIAVCSDIFSQNQNHGSYIIGLNSVAPFHGNRQLQRHMLSVIRLRAMEQQKFFLWASNYGKSYIISPSGDIQNQTHSEGYQILTGKIVPNEARTWYNRVGDWPILVASFAFSLVRFRKKE